VSCIYGGGIAGPNAVKYARGLQAMSDEWSFRKLKKKKAGSEQFPAHEQTRGRRIRFRLWQELGELMTKDCTVIRYNKNLCRRTAKLVELPGTLSQSESE